jgi:hypothetical protein
MNYATVKSELDPIISRNKCRLDEISNSINTINLEINEKNQKLLTLKKEHEALTLEQTKITRYYDVLTGLYYASLITQKTGEPLGGLYYRTNQLNTNELSKIVTEFKIFEVLHTFNVITTNRILCQRDNTNYITNELVNDIIVLQNCIYTCSNLYHSFVKKYKSSNVIELLKINLSESQKNTIVSIFLRQKWNHLQIIKDLNIKQKNNDTQIDRLMSKNGGTKLYYESEYYTIAQTFTKRLAEEKKKNTSLPKGNK